ncbi:MAG: isoprenylcysteine carboxylmethyltransferase family protein [Ahrensia sp.]
MTDRTSAPNTIPWPPLILVSALVGSWLVAQILPVQLPAALVPLGILLMIAALGVDVVAMLTMRRARTTILPHRGSQNLITHGIFSISRNPIYVANVVIIVGYALSSSSIWPLLAAPIAAFAMQKLAIEREEAHLSANFPNEFAAYRKKTRRWL